MKEGMNFYGHVEVVCGPMFSGKTEELIRRMKRAEIARQRYQVFKPEIDNRYGKEFVASHNANRMDAIPVSHSSQILDLLDDSTRIVGIDEAQFFDNGLVEVVERLANRGMRVICAGLDMDYRGKSFGPMAELMAIAEDVKKLPAICVVCGNPATRSQRVSASQEQVLVGAHDSYEARCRAHHRPIAEDHRMQKPWLVSETQTQPN
jgi:thymidine kinase